MSYAKLQVSASVNRPAWTQYNLEAYKNKYINGKIRKNHYIKSKGRQ